MFSIILNWYELLFQIKSWTFGAREQEQGGAMPPNIERSWKTNNSQQRQVNAQKNRTEKYVLGD